MMTSNEYLHEVVITAIIIIDNKYLITRRSAQIKRFKGMWVVPGGRLHPDDYLTLQKDTEHYWYNVLEKTLKREIQEEVGLEISNIDYITSLARVHEDGSPSLVISCIADFVGVEVKLQEDETDRYEWVTVEEAKEYDLIEGIYDELEMADSHRKDTKHEWQKIDL
jgi:8-oxo-dGTP diphosphatase